MFFLKNMYGLCTQMKTFTNRTFENLNSKMLHFRNIN